MLLQKVATASLQFHCALQRNDGKKPCLHRSSLEPGPDQPWTFFPQLREAVWTCSFGLWRPWETKQVRHAPFPPSSFPPSPRNKANHHCRVVQLTPAEGQALRVGCQREGCDDVLLGRSGQKENSRCWLHEKHPTLCKQLIR